MLRDAAPPGPRPAPVVASLIVHLSLLGLLAFSPRPSAKPLSAYQREIAPQEKKLVWYRFKDKLPDVSLPKPAARPRPTRALQKHPTQTIVAKSSRPDPAKQMILAPGPELKVEQELKAPNLMAFEAPKPPEPPSAPKLFMPPPEAPRPIDQPVLEAGPALPPEVAKPLEQMPAPRPEPRSFAPPPQVAKRIETPELQPGDVRIVPAQLEPIPLARLQLPARPEPKAFTPPPPKARPTVLSPALAAGPALAPPSTTSKTVAALPGQATLPARPQAKIFAPPTQRAANSARPLVPALEADTALASNLSAAVVGLNPVNTLPVVPEGSRPAQFSAAPEISPKGDASGPSIPGSIKMEDLAISGGSIKRDALPRESIVALTRVNPTSSENLLAAARSAPSRPAPLAPPPPPATGDPVRVSSAPDKRLDGRIVYTVAINMPNVTSYSGSWILWYAERQPAPGEQRRVLPPEPLHKVDPIYDLAAVDDRIEGKVQLSAIIHKDGFVYAINVVRGLDSRLDNNAVQALRKWEFTPAMVDGDPVDVDIVIEIPFRLRPKNK